MFSGKPNVVFIFVARNGLLAELRMSEAFFLSNFFEEKQGFVAYKDSVRYCDALSTSQDVHFRGKN